MTSNESKLATWKLLTIFPVIIEKKWQLVTQAKRVICAVVTPILWKYA